MCARAYLNTNTLCGSGGVTRESQSHFHYAFTSPCCLGVRASIILLWMPIPPVRVAIYETKIMPCSPECPLRIYTNNPPVDHQCVCISPHLNASNTLVKGSNSKYVEYHVNYFHITASWERIGWVCPSFDVQGEDAASLATDTGQY